MARFDFTKLDPADGLRVQRVENGESEVSLHLVVQEAGELVNPGTIGENNEDATVELVSWGNQPIGQMRGLCSRLELVLEAIARYLTTGGNWPDMMFALRGMQRLAPSGLELPGWHYHSGEPVYDADLDRVVWQHLFVSDEDRGELTETTLWVEGLFIEQGTLGQVLRERRRDEEQEGPGTRRTGDDSLELPDHSDHAAP